MLAAALLLQLSSRDLDQVWDDPKLKGAVVGVCVLDEKGKELYAHNADLRMVPASNEKLVTGAFALNALGPDFRPTIRFWKQKDFLVIDATGDPLMTHDHLLKIKDLLHIGKRRVVQLHNAYGPLLPPGWEWDDLRNKYAAPVSAFTVDRSSFELWAENGRLFYLPESYGAKAIYKGGDGPLSIEYDAQKMLAVVSGALPKDRTRLDTLAIGDPDFAAASILGKHPERVAAVPATEPTLVYQGEPLSKILKEDLPSSDNNIAENLMLIASGVTSADREPYSVASGKVRDFLTSQVGLQPEDFKDADGSGLSRHNVITPHAIAKLLAWADRQPTKDLWHSCLAKSGEEGTLKDRLQGIAFEGKTGTMDMVCSLSGYLHLKDGHTLIVSILVNDYTCSTAQTRDFQDMFIKKLLDAGNEGTLFAESHNHAGTRPNARTGRLAYYRIRRHGLDGRFAPARIDPGDEPGHEGFHRPERVALRAG